MQTCTIPRRHFSSSCYTGAYNRSYCVVYRYAFNGQEKETELNPSITSAEYWMYDGRLGRRWNVDPEYKKYPDISPFVCYFNSPLYFNDPLGDDPEKRYGGLKRFWNNISGNSFKNEANKFASDNNIDEKNVHIGSDRAVVIKDITTVGVNGDDITVTAKDQAYVFTEHKAFLFFKEGYSDVLNPEDQDDWDFSRRTNFSDWIEDDRGNLVLNLSNFGSNYLVTGEPAPIPITGGFSGGPNWVKKLTDLPKYAKNFNNLDAFKHTFRAIPNHVLATSHGTANRYTKLFSSVMSNPANKVTVTHPDKIKAGIELYRKTYRNGRQVWVEVINGKIRDAGVNLIPK